MEFLQLLIREQKSTTMSFEPELPSTRKYRTIKYTQLTSYLYIVHTFLV